MQTAKTTQNGEAIRRRITDRIPRPLLMILIGFVALATAWNIVLPPYENLDELEHAEVIRYIVITGRLPEHGVAEEAGFRVRQEASQPPLYHILAASWARVLHLPVAPHPPEHVPGAVVACGPTGTFYSKASWAHDPFAEGFPWRGPYLTLHMVRFFSTLLEVATLVGVWTLARRIFPRGWVPVLATSLVAFNPQFLLLAAGVNNDNAVIPLATWGLVLAYDLWRRPAAPGRPRWRPFALGLVAGLAALSKLSGLAVAGLGGLALLVRALEKRDTVWEFVRDGAVILVQVALVISPWVIRNIYLYNDPTALAPMLAKVGLREGPVAWGEARLMTLSYWAQLPCSFYARALYWPYLLLMAGGIVGLIAGLVKRSPDAERRTRRFSRRQRYLLALCAIWFVVITVAWLRWNRMTPAPGGRLLFPAIAAVALLMAAGWWALGGEAPRAQSLALRGWSAFLPVWAWVVLLAGPMMILAPPRMVPATEEHLAAVPNPTDIRFADAIRLHGWTARVHRPTLDCVLASSAYCGETLDVTLYWQAQRPLPRDYTMVLQLVSPVTGSTDLRLNYNRWPGRGNLPTTAWPSDRVVRDHYAIPLPASDDPTQSWALTVAFVDPTTDARLPVTVDGTAVGDAATLTQLRVAGTQPAAPQWGGLAQPVGFAPPEGTGDAIVLADAAVTQNAGSPWEVRLAFESRAPVQGDYVVFVHAYDAAGELLATGDGPPRDGAFPTRLWTPDDRVISTHTLALDDGAAERAATIAVGLYLPSADRRLAATQAGARLPDDAIVIWRAADSP